MIHHLFDWLKGKRTVAESSGDSEISIGVRNNGTVDLDLHTAADGWSTHNLSIKDAVFIIEHLAHAVALANPLRGIIKPDIDSEFSTLQPDP